MGVYRYTKLNSKLPPIPVLQIPVGGVIAVAIPYVVGMTFDRHHLPALKVFGCAENDIGDALIIGRDVMNRYRIEFDGTKLEFEIS